MPALSASFRLLMTTDAVGGVWRYALDLCRTVSLDGVAPILVGLGPNPSDAQKEEAKADNIPLLWLDEALDWQAGDHLTLARTGRALDRVVRSCRPDIVHLNGPALAPFVGGHVPQIVAVHSCLATWWHAVKEGRLPDTWRWHLEATARGLAAGNTVVVPSASFAAALHAVYDELPRLVVVPNGATLIEPAPKGRFVLAAGRWWDEAKNLACLEEAAAKASISVHAAGPMAEPDTPPVTPRSVRWLGDLPHAELRQWHARAPIFTSLSLYEPFGLSVLEAASAGTALVLSAIPTFLELWGGCALFVDPRRPAEAGEAFDRLHRDDALRQRLAEAARQRARSFTLERQALTMMEVWKPLLGAQRLAG